MSNIKIELTKQSKLKDLDLEKVMKVALQCEGRFEFQQKFKSEYNWAQSRFVLDEVCKHMEAQRISKWTFDLLLERGKLEGHKNISQFILSGASKWNTLSKEDQNKVRDFYPRTKSKPVLKFDINMNFIEEFESANAAVKSLGLTCNGSQINSCCNGKIKTAYGFIWKRKF